MSKELGGNERAERGSVTVMVVIMAIALVATIGLAVDGGMMWATKGQVTTLSAEAARAAADELSLSSIDTGHQPRLAEGRAEQAAVGFLKEPGGNGATIDSVSFPTSSSVCVTVSKERSTLILSIVGLRTYTATSTSCARPEEGA
jgi:Flp pilus assembly protein TadG